MEKNNLKIFLKIFFLLILSVFSSIFFSKQEYAATCTNPPPGKCDAAAGAVGGGPGTNCCTAYVCTAVNPVTPGPSETPVPTGITLPDGGIINGTCVLIPAGAGVSSPPTATVKNPCPSNNCITAIGNIDVSTGSSFITVIFRVLLSLSGGIALLLIVYSGFNMVMSQGNPEKVKGAQETLTSAIIGLLFVILSVAILQIIGLDILQLPGFKSGTAP